MYPSNVSRVVLFITLGLMCSPGYAQQPAPFLRLVTLRANIEVNAGSDILSYSYTVTNSELSAGSVWAIEIDISEQTGGVNLSAQGLVNGPGFLGQISQAVQESSSAVPVVPVGLQAPPHWRVGPSVNGHVVWNAAAAQAFIAPRGSMTGYQMLSRGLPAIRHFVAKPYLDVETLPIRPPFGPNDLARYEQDLATLETSVEAEGESIGPTAPPANFVAQDFLKTLQSYKKQALQQGWIKNAGIANSLDAKLNAAQASLTRGNTGAAKNQLNAFLDEVVAQTDKQLTSEAVALLRFNAQYLISKIP